MKKMLTNQHLFAIIEPCKIFARKSQIYIKGKVKKHESVL